MPCGVRFNKYILDFCKNYILLQLRLIFMTKSGGAGQTLPPVNSVSHSLARLQTLELKKITELTSQTTRLGKSRLMSLVL